MNEIKLTVYFDDPFWVGVFERLENGRLSVSKVTFGAEPRDYEVWEFILKRYYGLGFSPRVTADIKPVPDNPKRRQRSAAKQLKAAGVGTRSQQALAAQRDETKLRKRQLGKERKEAEKQRRFELKQQKRKEKHRGR